MVTTPNPDAFVWDYGIIRGQARSAFSDIVTQAYL